MVDISQLFCDDEETVINYRGKNYYLACDALVTNTAKGQSMCVKRVNHPGDIHEDFDGNKTHPRKG